MNDHRSIIIIVALTSLLFLIATIKQVSAANDIRFIFNNGFVPSANIKCSDSELQLMDAIFAPRRALRGNNNEHDSANANRDLYSIQYCTNVCKGMIVGTCRRTGCVGLRELEVAGSDKGGRSLGACDDQIAAIHQDLDTLSLQVSDSCKAYLDRSKRTSDCFPNTVYGAVDGIRIWNITSNTVQSVFHPQEMILPNQQIDLCKSMRLNIESMNQPCVEYVEFVVTGPSNYHQAESEAIAPFAMFGNTKTNFNGKYLSYVGLYTVKVTPDRDPSKAKYFYINAKEGC